MSTHCDLYSWSVSGTDIAIAFQGWKTFLGMTTSTCMVRYYGKKQADGSIFWLQDDGSVVSEKMERYLNRTHQQYSLKNSIAA